MPSNTSDFQIGTKVGNYVLVDKIGSGGIGTVYKARHVLLNYSAAVKVHEYFPENALVGIAFLQSASYLSQFNHPNIVRLYDYGFCRGHAYMAMEFVEGDTLFNLMPKSDEENWTERAEEWTHEAIHYFMQLLSAVRYAHNCVYLDLAGNTVRGVVHGDIKPGNILISRETGKLKLTDFMILDVQAYLGKSRNSRIPHLPRNLPEFYELELNIWRDLSLTRAEMVILSERMRTEEWISEFFGTPGYMPPEQQAGRVSVRTDIFTLGATLYGILTGHSPAFRFLRGEPRSDNPFIPKWVEEVILKSTHPDPSERYGSVAEIEAIFRENYGSKSSHYSIEELVMGNKIDIMTGDISDISGQLFIGKFNSVIANLKDSGQVELAQGLRTLKEAVMASSHLVEENKREHMEVINQIGEEAVKPKPNKTLLKMLSDGLMTALRAIPDVAKAVTMIAPLLKALCS